VYLSAQFTVESNMRELQEVVPIVDTLCSGIGAIERLGGGLLRFWLYVEQTCPENGVTQKVVVAKIVAPTSAVPDAVLQMIASISDSAATIVPLVSDLVN
jgi:hypothetical protein